MLAYMKRGKILIGLLLFTSGFTIEANGESLWMDLPQHASERSVLAEVEHAPQKYRAVRFNILALRGLLQSAESRGEQASVALNLPMPNGASQDFLVERSSVMPEELRRKFPNIQTFEGHAVDDPATSLRLEVTPKGVSAQVLAVGQRWMIDPRLGSSPDVSISYFSKDLTRASAEPFCELESPPPVRGKDPFTAKKPQASPVLARSSGTTLRTYRLAVATTGEYGQFHGGTVSQALAAVVTTINRVDGIYEKEMAISLELVGNNDAVVYVDPATDPFNGNNSAGTLINESQTELDATIGLANYDVGHTFSTGAGGLAGLGVVCGAAKGEGVTGRPNPIGDAYDVDYVAHEIGHQFDGNHTFNGANNACSGGNRNGGTAYEPGSGSTIQAYAGICGIDNLQANSDPIFHSESFDEMYGYASSGAGASCAVETATGNSAPAVNAGADYTVPAGTPLVVTGSATDVDGDSLTYLWEQRDLGGQASLAAPDDGAIPLFRVYEPVSTPIRYLPQLTSVVSGNLSNEEKIPASSRSMVLRLTARDGQGGVSSDDITVTVDGGKGPFQLLSPNGGESLGASATVTWDAAGSADAPVSAQNVEFYLSTDGGETFGENSFATTPNTGSAALSFPSDIDTNTARLLIQGQNNIFYDVSDADFSLNSGQPPPPDPVFLAIQPIDSGANLYFAPGEDNDTEVGSYSGSCSTESVTTTLSDDVSPGFVIDGSEVVTSTLAFAQSILISADGLEVSVNISHPWRGDLEIDLVSPSGTSVRLRNANANDNTPGLQGVFPTTLVPAESMGVFAGENAQGTWSLLLNDTYPQLDDGILNSWGVTVTSVTAGDLVSATVTSSPLTFTGMTNGETYTCEFMATVDGLDSAAVGAGTVVPAEILNPPGQPAIISIEGVEGALIVAVAPGSGPSPDAYRVVCGAVDAVSNDATVTVSGLEDGVDYTCYAMAAVGSSSSVPSIGLSATAGDTLPGLPIWLLYEASK